MAAPVYSAGTPGNLVNGVSVAHGTTIAAFLDLSTSIEGQLTCETIVGASPPTNLTAFSIYKAYAAGSSAPITFGAAAAAGATSLSVSSKTGLSVGQNLCLQQAGGDRLGELAKISAISGSAAPYTLTIPSPGLVNSYSTNDFVYLLAQMASFTVSPSSSSGAYVANTDYSTELFLGPGQWIVAAQNSDTTYSVTVNVTYDRITSIA